MKFVYYHQYFISLLISSDFPSISVVPIIIVELVRLAIVRIFEISEYVRPPITKSRMVLYCDGCGIPPPRNLYLNNKFYLNPCIIVPREPFAGILTISSSGVPVMADSLVHSFVSSVNSECISPVILLLFNLTD
jgi:hypothetical protein